MIRLASPAKAVSRDPPPALRPQSDPAHIGTLEGSLSPISILVHRDLLFVHDSTVRRPENENERRALPGPGPFHRHHPSSMPAVPAMIHPFTPPRLDASPCLSLSPGPWPLADPVTRGRPSTWDAAPTPRSIAQSLILCAQRGGGPRDMYMYESSPEGISEIIPNVWQPLHAPYTSDRSV
jgi:hypothetical protein